jgi:hypothetical protein
MKCPKLGTTTQMLSWKVDPYIVIIRKQYFLVLESEYYFECSL